MSVEEPVAWQRRAPVTAVVAADSPLVLCGMQSLLRRFLPEITSLAGATSACDAQMVTDQLRPQLLLAELVLCGGPDVPVVQELATRSPGTRVVVLTSDHDVDMAERCMRSGAHGLVLKTSTVDSLVLAVRTVLEGNHFVDVALAVARTLGLPQREDGSARLSGRDKEILRLVSLGFTNAQISSRLLVSLRTVEARRATIRERLRLNGRAEFAAYARDHGLAPSHPCWSVPETRRAVGGGSTRLAEAGRLQPLWQ